MKLEAFNQPRLFDELRDEWDDLVFRSTGNRIFSTWEWQSTWWDAYHPGELWVITCRDEQGLLIGLAPWFIGTNVEQQRFVSTIGCKEVTDYLDLIVDQAHVEPVLEQIAAYVADHRAQFDVIELCNIPEHSVSHEVFPKFLEEHGFTVTLEHEDVCPVVELPGDWTEYLNMLDKKQRHELRRKLRRAQGQNSSVEWYIVGPEDNLADEMQHFLDMMAASDSHKAEFLEDSQNATFFKQIAPVMDQKGWLQLCFLKVNGERAAAYLNFDYNHQILVYNSGLRPNEYGHLSAGIVLLAHNIQHAIQTGHTAFDFLQGDEAYKYHMGGQDVHVFNLKATFAGQ
ncbi:MAG: GNAT family N-acetyltransferase [Anaerolineae bacterium]|nr:GNAT family N-acetyltransferase [Anaerolineae bacterium]